VSLRKYIIDRFNDIECNGEKVASTSYLIGTGPPLPLYSAWTVAFSTAQATFKYFSSTSLQAKEQLIAFGEQFGTTSTGLEARWYEAIDDVALLPATIYAVVPGTRGKPAISPHSFSFVGHTHAKHHGPQVTTCES
jgi:hypothetical protein